MNPHVFWSIVFVTMARLAYSDEISAMFSVRDAKNDAPISVQITTIGPQTNAISDPPVEDASDPRRIIRYFCRAWKDQNYRAMYGAMSDNYRSLVSFNDFEALYRNDMENNGGLQDENIEPNEVTAGAAIRLKVQLMYRSDRVKPRTVITEVIKTGKGYRIVESGILPIDMNNL